VMPLSEASVRAPMALAGIINVIVVFLAGRLLFDRPVVAWIAALVLALAPLHLIESRFANDTGLPATFAAIWALAMLGHLRHGGARKLIAGGVALGIGCFCYVGALPLMPLYALITLAALRLQRAPAASYGVFLAGFVVPVLLGGAWLVRHPEVVETTFLHYQNDQFRTLDGQTLGLLATMRRLAELAHLYIQFWNPTALFMFGAPWLMHSTRRAGIVLVATAGLLIVGLVYLAARLPRDSRALILLGGFLLAPVPASLVDINEHTSLHATWRAFAMLPFAALIVGVGVDALLIQRGNWARKVGMAAAVGVPLALVVVHGVSLPHRRLMMGLLVGGTAVAACSAILGWRESLVRTVMVAIALTALLQFWDFYADYIGDYQNRFTIETDGNVRDVLEAVIDRSPPVQPGRLRAAPAVYLGFRLGAGDWAGFYWRFYLHKQRREDLLARTINDANASRFDETFVCHLPAQSILTTPARKDPPTDALIESMIQKREVVSHGLVGVVRDRPTFWLLETTGTCTVQ